MKAVRFTGAFKKDFRRVERRGYSLRRFDNYLALLRSGQPLPASARPHRLKGQWQDFFECHIAPDWLLIYRETAEEILLARTGTHADLFDE